MSKDLITSYSQSPSSFSQNYSVSQTKPNANQKLPFSKDVLEAMERGDMDTAMKLLQKEKAASAGPETKIFAVFADLLKGLEALLQQIFQQGPKKKVEKKEIQAIQNALNAEAGKKSVTDQLKILIENSKESARSLIEKFGDIINYLKSKSEGILDFANMAYLKGQMLAMELMQKLNEVMVKPVTEWVNAKVEQLMDILKSQLQALDRATKPFRDKVSDISTRVTQFVGNQFTAIQKWVQELAIPIIDKTKEAYEAVEKRIKRALNKVQDAASKVKKGAEAITEPLIHFIQIIPAVIAPFAFWLLKQAEIPANNIRENIRRWIKNTKKAINWMGKKGQGAYKQLQKMASAIAKGGEFAYNWIERKVISPLMRAIAWIYKKCVAVLIMLSKVMFKVGKLLLKSIAASAAYLWQGVPVKIRNFFSRIAAKVVEKY